MSRAARFLLSSLLPAYAVLMVFAPDFVTSPMREVLLALLVMLAVILSRKANGEKWKAVSKRENAMVQVVAGSTVVGTMMYIGLTELAHMDELFGLQPFSWVVLVFAVLYWLREAYHALLIDSGERRNKNKDT